MADLETPDPSGSQRQTALNPEDRKLALITFAATLAANVATLAVAGVALLAYRLGPRLANVDGGSWTAGLLLGWIILVSFGHKVFDRWFFGGKKVGRLDRIIWILYVCADALVFVFLLFFVLGKLISVK
jgi:hypothetical protein